MEYVEFIENATRTRQSELSTKPRGFLPKMFATGGDRNPVTIFKEFAMLSSQNTYKRSTLPVLCVKSILTSLVQAIAVGSEQGQRHDEGRNQRNNTGRFMENLIQLQQKENSSKEAENKSNGPPKQEVTR